MNVEVLKIISRTASIYKSVNLFGIEEVRQVRDDIVCFYKEIWNEIEVHI